MEYIVIAFWSKVAESTNENDWIMIVIKQVYFIIFQAPLAPFVK
jgi:hypothetical protein